MLKILIVEDSDERSEFLSGLYDQHLVYLCKSSAGAIELLTNASFDLVHLDFDLEDGPSGETVARFIAAEHERTPVVIHSENSVGVIRIKTVLKDAIAVPFKILSAKNDSVARLKALLAQRTLGGAQSIIETLLPLVTAK